MALKKRIVTAAYINRLRATRWLAEQYIKRLEKENAALKQQLEAIHGTTYRRIA